MKGLVCVVLTLLSVSVYALPGPETENGYVSTDFKAYTWASNLNKPRQIYRLPNNEVLVLESGSGSITLLWDSGNKGVASDRVVLTQLQGLNHAVLYHENYIYASDPSTVYRWPYQLGNHSALGTPQTLVENIPGDGNHVTRTLAFDSLDRLYVTCGSAGNVDRSSWRSRIYRYNLSDVVQSPANWSSGELFADGMRNEVGIRFDVSGRLWSVENGMDNLQRPDLASGISNSNPAEEVNLLPNTNLSSSALQNTTLFYGYPMCWSEYLLPANVSRGPGAQFAEVSFMTNYTDSWCSNLSNVVPPAFVMPAHMAPLDILFYERTADNIIGNWPYEMFGDAFVSLHGSWDANPPVGYKVIHLQFDKQTGLPANYSVMWSYKGPGDKGSGWNYRPVGLTFGNCQGADCLLVTSDATGDVTAVIYTGDDSSSSTTGGDGVNGRIDDLEDKLKWMQVLVVLVFLLLICLACVVVGVFGFGCYKVSTNRSYATI